MTDNSDEAWLIGLANDVCDGKPVDWERVVPPGAAAESQQMVAELRRLATVVDAHRTLGEDAPAPAPAPDPITTSGVWGPLVLLETVGHGAFGTVYRAWDAQLDREVALKVLLQVPLESPLEEARHLARIRHPNVVSVYGAERVDEQVGIWMEFIEGETLGTVVGERGPMSAREVAGIGIDLCRALSALHRSDLVHGDIKAQNVMREVGGRIVLMDFSGVRAPDAHAAPEFSGTPPYIAPELFEGRGASFGADIYSLGVLLFYLLSGHFPVDGEDVAEIRRRHASGERVRLRDIRPELPDAVVEIIERATAVDRGERFRTAGDLEHALMGIFAGHGASSGADSARAGARASRAGWVLAAAAVIALAGSIAAWRYVPRDRVPAGPLVRLWVGPPYNTGPWPRVAPDGSSIVFGTTVDGRKVLWLHPLGSGQGHAIKAAETTETAFWSADSRRIGFFSDGKLKTVDVGHRTRRNDCRRRHAARRIVECGRRAALRSQGGHRPGRRGRIRPGARDQPGSGPRGLSARLAGVPARRQPLPLCRQEPRAGTHRRLLSGRSNRRRSASGSCRRTRAWLTPPPATCCSCGTGRCWRSPSIRRVPFSRANR